VPEDWEIVEDWLFAAHVPDYPQAQKPEKFEKKMAQYSDTK
jgi:hypothetical protein